MKNKILTAEEVLTKFGFNAKQINQDFAKAMIEFAKLHCKRQAEVIAEKATWKCDSSDSYFGDNGDYDFCDRDNDGDKTQIHTISVDKDSILNAYNLEEEIK